MKHRPGQVLHQHQAGLAATELCIKHYLCIVLYIVQGLQIEKSRSSTSEVHVGALLREFVTDQNKQYITSLLLLIYSSSLQKQNTEQYTTQFKPIEA